MMLIRTLFAALAACVLPITAKAQNLIFLPAENYGQATKVFNESSLNEAQLEVLMGRSAVDEAVAELDETNAYRRPGRSIALHDLLKEDRFRERYNTDCSATRIASDLILTDFHCVPGKDFKTIAAQARFGFLDSLTARGQTFEVDIAPIEASEALDYVIFKLKRVPDIAAFPPVALRRQNVRDGESLILIHHPMGQPQRLTRFRCQAGRPAISEGRLVHHCDTQGGSSGAAVLTLEGFAFAGLHFGGVPHPERPFNLAKPAADLFRASATLRGLDGSEERARQEAERQRREAEARLAEAQRKNSSGFTAYNSRDYATARRDWQAACDGGNPKGCFNLGFLYEKGHGVTQDYAAARRLYQQGCDGGAAGCSNLGNLVYRGLGGAQNQAEGTRLLRKGCAEGNQWGCDRLSEYGIARQ